jgi:hypothetical protein
MQIKNSLKLFLPISRGRIKVGVSFSNPLKPSSPLTRKNKDQSEKLNDTKIKIHQIPSSPLTGED